MKKVQTCDILLVDLQEKITQWNEQSAKKKKKNGSYQSN